ncbi:MAG: TlyA family RNA methyltransferase [Acidobacteria bacterium]|nr:TlyA family RNA methyltransferase [Acidobacteriota bacterium]
MKKQRLDLVLVERGLAATRAKAQSLVMARRVTVNGIAVDKAGAGVANDDVVALVELEHPWVGRGGMKLAAALDRFAISPEGLVCADIGASTGGFTDVLLQQGAKKVYAIDVGYGQLDAKLRADARVVNREKCNARYLDASDFDDPVELVSIDVSFISLKLILPAVLELIVPRGRVIALIKPQFEVGKGEVGKGGIVRDDAIRAAAVDGIVAFATALGFDVEGLIESPIKGAEGNVEYLVSLVAQGGEGREASGEE